MNTPKLYLGIGAQPSIISGERLWIQKHSWDCGWYFAFGYIGNRNLHTHIESLIAGTYDINKIFKLTNITQNQWWVIRDLFMQAYALKKCAEVYQYGGYQLSVKNITDCIENKSRADEINKDLGHLLDVTWAYLESILGAFAP